MTTGQRDPDGSEGGGGRLVWFWTESGSVYQCDPDARTIRRLTGTHDPTPNQGADGAWQSYAVLSPEPITLGAPVVVVWKVAAAGATTTSPVTRIDIDLGHGTVFPALSARLLKTPTFTVAALAAARHEPAATTEAWMRDEVAGGRLLAVPAGADGALLVPGFQLDADGAVRAELVPLLASLHAADLPPWICWVWLITPTPLLSGAVPDQLARTQPTRALTAARRFAARGDPPP